MENSKSGRSCFAAPPAPYVSPRSSGPVAKRRKGKHSVVKDLSVSRSSASVCKRRKDVSWATARATYVPFVKPGRIDRRQDALSFRRKICMSSVFTYHIEDGVPLCSKPATSIGITWVAVHGIDSICAVARSKDLVRLKQDQMPQMDRLFEHFLRNLWNSIISEVEDIAAPSGKSRQRYMKGSQKPFGVVTVIIEDTDKSSSAEYDAEKAIEFLRGELESWDVFTHDKTAQTAISALQHLFCQEFEADEIRAFVLKDASGGWELNQFRENSDVEEFLAIIHEE